jgi:hypothetical protein
MAPVSTTEQIMTCTWPCLENVLVPMELLFPCTVTARRRVGVTQHTNTNEILDPILLTALAQLSHSVLALSLRLDVPRLQ